ncbi:hypothetical protein AVEN_167947-1 [Araneus ventricosus]|uniref:Uncharacterized protein n=1 Tax=Araneus ventricosus TaxID=182803 RepID=A0A4Y2SC32_ARAVE|nr:hypothetical protein AVEN_167947-1 [Araneus ventricosus]
MLGSQSALSTGIVFGVQTPLELSFGVLSVSASYELIDAERHREQENSWRDGKTTTTTQRTELRCNSKNGTALQLKERNYATTQKTELRYNSKNGTSYTNYLVYSLFPKVADVCHMGEVYPRQVCLSIRPSACEQKISTR